MDSRTPFIIIGDDASARDALDITLAIEVLVYGFFSLEETQGLKEVNDVSIITQFGSDEANALLAEEEIQLAVAATDREDRRTIADILEQYSRKPANLIHPTAVISSHAKLGFGNIILPQVVIQANASLGNYIHLHSGAVIEADVELGDFVNVRTGAKIGQKALIGDNVHIGMGAVIFPAVSIGEGAIIAPGAVVLEDVAEGQSVAGNPASLSK